MENPVLIQFYNLIKPHVYLLEVFDDYVDKMSDERCMKFIENVINQYVSFNYSFNENVSDFDSPRMFPVMTNKFINKIIEVGKVLMNKQHQLELGSFSFMVSGDSELLILDSENEVINMDDMGAVLTHLFIALTLEEARIVDIEDNLSVLQTQTEGN